MLHVSYLKLYDCWQSVALGELCSIGHKTKDEKLTYFGR